jgi:ABC-type transport system involved in Fe-S cluster assembly fused permease/ATPase subunit
VAGIEASVAINGYIQAIRRGGSSVGLQLMRLVTGTTCYVVEFAGALALTLGYVAGLYVAAIAMVIMLAFTISGAWLLIVGASGQQSERHGSLKAGEL